MKTDMKRFLIKGTVFAAILSICVAIFNGAYFKFDPYHVEKFKNVPEQIEICNIGASHSEYSFNYEDYDSEYVTFNFALQNQSHMYDYEVLKQYKDNLREGSIVFIVVSYPMLLCHDEIDDKDFNSKNKRYYFFLPPESIRQYNLDTDIKTTLFPFTCLDKDVKDMIETYGSDPDIKGWERVTDVQEAKEHAEKPYLRLVENSKTDSNGNIIFLQEAVDAIYKMIELCHQQGAVPILLTTPFTKVYSNRVKTGFPEYDAAFSQEIRQIQNDTGVEYYDYSTDDRFSENYNYFLNSDHLNKEGAKVFTDIVMKEIVKNRVHKS